MPAQSRQSGFSFRLRTTCSVLALAAIGAPGAASALPSVYATQTYTLDGTNTVSNSSVADVLPAYNVGTNSIFGHSYAYPTGTNGSRSSGSNNFSINGTSTFEEFFTNSTGSAETLNIPFEIANGEVAMSMASTAIGIQTAGVDANIALTVNGAPVTGFEFKADMTLTSNGAGTSNLTFSQSGPQIGGTPLPANTPGVTSGSYSWGTYDSTVGVTLQPGDNLEFLYTISSYHERLDDLDRRLLGHRLRRHPAGGRRLRHRRGKRGDRWRRVRRVHVLQLRDRADRRSVQPRSGATRRAGTDVDWRVRRQALAGLAFNRRRRRAA